MLNLTYRGHKVEKVDYREIIDSDGTAFHQFLFVVDGKGAVRDRVGVDVPKFHRVKYPNDEAFELMIARSAVNFFEQGLTIGATP